MTVSGGTPDTPARELFDEGWSGPRRRRNSALSWAMLAAVIAGFAWFLAREEDRIRRMHWVEPRWLGVLAATFVANLVLQGIVLQRTMRAIGQTLGLSDCLRLSVSTTMLNFLLPAQAGFLFRGFFLVRERRWTLSSFVAVTLAMMGLSVFVNLSLGLVAVVGISATAGKSDPIIYAVLVGGLAFFGGIAALSRERVERWQGGRPIAAMLEGWHALRASPSDLTVNALSTLAMYISCAVGYGAAFASLGLPAPVLGMLALPASAVVGSLAVLPGPFGFPEVFGMYYATILPVTPAEALVALLTLKIVKVAVATVAGVPCLLTLRGEARAGGEDLGSKERWDGRAILGRARAVLDPCDARGSKNRFIEEILRQSLEDAIPLSERIRVMDFGCGSGLLADHLVGRVGRYVGVDLSAGMLDLARRSSPPRASFCRYDGRTLPFRKGAFDLVVTRGVLHLIPDGSLAPLAEQIRNCLAPGGAIVAMEFSSSSPRRQSGAIGRYDRSPTALIRIFEAAGLVCEDHRPIRRGRSLRQYLVRYGWYAADRIPEIAERERADLSARRDLVSRYYVQIRYVFRRTHLDG